MGEVATILSNLLIILCLIAIAAVISYTVLAFQRAKLKHEERSWLDDSSSWRDKYNEERGYTFTLEKENQRLVQELLALRSRLNLPPTTIEKIRRGSHSAVAQVMALKR